MLRNAENIIAKFSVPDKKIMITSDEMVFVWYDFEGTFDEMIAECEKRVAKKYAGSGNTLDYERTITYDNTTA